MKTNGQVARKVLAPNQTVARASGYCCCVLYN